MRWHTRSITWHGEAFQFQQLPADRGDAPVQWAVRRHGEFIGTMPCSPRVTTREFDLRCMRWLRDLLGPRWATMERTEH
jgi:hypothetical protein